MFVHFCQPAWIGLVRRHLEFSPVFAAISIQTAQLQTGDTDLVALVTYQQ